MKHKCLNVFTLNHTRNKKRQILLSAKWFDGETDTNGWQAKLYFGQDSTIYSKWILIASVIKISGLRELEGIEQPNKVLLSVCDKWRLYRTEKRNFKSDLD